MIFRRYIFRRAEKHLDVIDYRKVEDNVRFVYPKETRRRWLHFGHRTIYVDESGEPSISDRTIGNRFGIGAVVTRRPKKIEQLGESYPKFVESGRNAGREYKYSTIKTDPKEVLLRAEELGRMSADYFCRILVKESNPGNIMAYEVYRTNLYKLLDDICKAYPHSHFDLYTDFTTTITMEDLERECVYFSRITPHQPIKNSPNGGLRVADMVTGIITDEAVNSPYKIEGAYEAIEDKIVNKNRKIADDNIQHDSRNIILITSMVIE